MANEYAVNSADLTVIADAIRSKGGTSAALSFPGGFVDAVSAIQTGGGSSDGNIAGSDTPDGNLMSNLLYGLTSGTAASGEFTLSSAPPAVEMTVFDSGLESIRGFFILNMDWDGTTDAKNGWIAWTAALVDTDSSVTEWVKNTSNPFALMQGYSGIAITGWHQTGNNGAVSPLPYITSIRLDSGKLLCTPQYAGNASYTPFKAGCRHVWFAW